MEISVRKYYPYLELSLAWYALLTEREFVPEVAHCVSACGAKNKKPALPLTRRAGFRIMAVVVSVGSTYHEYMRDKLRYSP